jgi:hypothetical protein
MKTNRPLGVFRMGQGMPLDPAYTNRQKRTGSIPILAPMASDIAGKPSGQTGLKPPECDGGT